jgi:cytochrome c biogenesis protein CcmG, thiol:disulfide interchange protein DsbE
MTELTQDSPQAAPQPARGGLSLGSIVLIIGVLMVIVVFGLQLASQNLSQPTSGRAPEFETVTYFGSRLHLADLRGKVVVLNFWASWCGPCRVEAPDLQHIYETYRARGVEFLGISYLDTEEDARGFMRDFGLTYINAIDEGSRISDLYHIEAVPETFIIDQNGDIAHFFLGPIDVEELAAVLDTLTGSAS